MQSQHSLLPFYQLLIGAIIYGILIVATGKLIGVNYLDVLKKLKR
jgi:hypothetical protein